MNCKINKGDFIIFPLKNKFKVVFSTANNGVNFNKGLEEGINNLKDLKEHFNVDEVVFLNQIHGSEIKNYNGCNEIINTDGDGIISNIKSVIFGVFTADCVPIIIVDEEKGAMAALHSGWKGTISNIAAQGVMGLIESYDSKPEDMKVFIGPHNKVCCYEVSEELIERFKNCKDFNGIDISEGRKLNLQRCIEVQLKNMGIKEVNISKLELCTYCSEETKLYSYRKEDGSKGRLFSFVFADEED